MLKGKETLQKLVNLPKEISFFLGDTQQNVLTISGVYTKGDLWEAGVAHELPNN